MVLLEGSALGWLLIVIGAVLLLVEVHPPGFFATVPATVMIFLGILHMPGIDIFNSGRGVIVGVVIALAAAGFTVGMYGKRRPNESPTTIRHESLIDMDVRVKTTVNPYLLPEKLSLPILSGVPASRILKSHQEEKVKVVDHKLSNRRR